MEVLIKWIRHGQTLANEAGKYLGRTEEHLSEAGKKQLPEFTRDEIENLYLVSSPMIRCVESVEVMTGRRPDAVIENWREIDFGDFEGKNYMELSGNDDYQKWIDSNGTLPFPNGESKDEFVRRTLEGFYELCHRLSESSKLKKLLCVVHGGTIMAIISSLTGEAYFSYQVKNGKGYETLLDITEEKIMLKYMKEIH